MDPKQETDIQSTPHSNCLFDQPWWLNTVAPGAWREIAIEKGGRVVGRWPLIIQKKFGLTLLRMPPFTQVLGPWLRPSNAKYVKQLSQQKNLLSQLIDQLPQFDYFSQCFHHSQQNWLPFYWRGFQQTTRYTYVIEDLTDLDAVWKAARENIRTDVRKAQKQLEVRTEGQLRPLMDLVDMSYERQNKDPNYSRKEFARIDEVCASRNARKIFCAYDGKGRLHAGVYIVWDEKCAYYIMGGGDPELRNSGAHSLVMWEAIKFAQNVTRQFDFEGSMAPAIERFFRAFGARQKPYFRISKCNSKLLKAALTAREAFSG